MLILLKSFPNDTLKDTGLMYSNALLNSENILTESNIFCKYIIPIIRKVYAMLLLTTTLMKKLD